MSFFCLLAWMKIGTIWLLPDAVLKQMWFPLIVYVVYHYFKKKNQIQRGMKENGVMKKISYFLTWAVRCSNRHSEKYKK